jgi:hypothetical protein
MLTILKTATLFFFLGNNTTYAQADIMPILTGSQTDTHGCVTDGGYQWCKSTQRCQRIWELPCEDLMVPPPVTDFCETSNIQTCRMACPELSCPSTQCAMRIDNCCDYVCSDNQQVAPVCPKTCPPPAPCPMPPMDIHCNVVPAITDHCGCTTGCPSLDCSTRPMLTTVPADCTSWNDGCNVCGVSNGQVTMCTERACFRQGTPFCAMFADGTTCSDTDCSTMHSNTVQEGQTCGGFMPYGMAGVCGDGLECVYTMGPMIADAPGTCMPVCPTSRDEYGNCIRPNTIPQIPHNCVTWYDGCNTCSVDNGSIQGCTMMMCFTQNEPYCQVFTSGDLHLGDMCFRFCEDGSQNQINRQKDCPIGTECSSSSTSMVSFDSCGTRAHTCNLLSGH